MKILVVRGRNLASLAGDFEIDLRADPLGRTPLFAITGPTGSGKSTLLDTICLALFARIPRLVDAKGEEIGRPDDPDRLKAYDPRGVLRRGCGEGFAEVEFAGNDGTRYRARWSVNRAYKRATGKLQEATHQLFEADTGVPIADKKSETPGAVEERLGLSFGQFGRAALLAQGDFAAFLKANDDERANLLERMTGTWIYGELSKAAYGRAREAQRQLTELENELKAYKVLEPDARTALEADIADREAGLAAARQRHEAVKAAAAWYSRRAQLARAEQDADTQHRLSEEAWTASAPGRVALAEIEEADRSLRPRFDHGEAAARAEQAAGESHEQAAKAMERAEQTHTAAAAGIEQATAGLERARLTRKEAQPDLDEARRLDDRLTQARDAVAEAEKAHDEAKKASTAAAAKLAQLRERITRGERTRDEATAWLADHADVEQIAAAWTAVQQTLQRCAAATAELTALQSQQADVEAAGSATRRTLDSRTRQLEAAGEALDGAEVALKAADSAAARYPAAEARRVGQQLTQRKASLDAARTAAEEAATLASDRLQATTALEDARSRERVAGSTIEALESERPTLVAGVKQADDALQRVQAALGLEERRAQLQSGRPCPLCGSEVHPWAEHAPPLARALADQQRAVDELRTRLSDLDRDLVAAREQRSSQQTRARDAAQRQADLDARIERVAARWSTLGATVDGLPAEATDERAVSQVTEALATIAAELDTARARIVEAEGLEAAAAAARQARDRARTDRDGAIDAHRQAEREASDASGVQTQLRRQLDVLQRQRNGLVEDLATPFVQRQHWREQLAADPSAFEAACRREVETWNAQAAARDAAARQLDDDGLRAEPATRDAADTAGRESAGHTVLEQRQADLGRLTAARNALLDGSPARDVESTLDRAIQAADDALTSARATLDQALAIRTAALADHRSAADALERYGRERATAVAALDEALASLGMDRNTLVARLAHDRPWIEAEQARFVELDRQRQQAAGRVEESAKARAAHEASAAPDIAEPDIAATMTGAEGAVQLADEALEELRVGLVVDDNNRAAIAATAPEIEDRKATARLWWSLSDLIGSASGMRFKKFAQSLTLDVLLIHANEQLVSLRPRYQLQRVPGHDLALQVIDRDMGDEIRSVRSLSGGETFLVSLALALALAALAARQTSVDSLFIDEGFGTLDDGTLGVALSALQGLEDSGKQIGLISHVPGLANHIGVQVVVEPQGGGRSKVSVVES